MHMARSGRDDASLESTDGAATHILSMHLSVLTGVRPTIPFGLAKHELGTGHETLVVGTGDEVRWHCLQIDRFPVILACAVLPWLLSEWSRVKYVRPLQDGVVKAPWNFGAPLECSVIFLILFVEASGPMTRDAKPVLLGCKDGQHAEVRLGKWEQEAGLVGWSAR